MKKKKYKALTDEEKLQKNVSVPTKFEFAVSAELHFFLNRSQIENISWTAVKR